MTIEPGDIAVVTGASSGIGAATAYALAAAGATVHAIARRADRLDELAAATGCVSHVLDVRETYALEDLLTSLQVDILVNNAGLGRAMGSLASATVDDVVRTVDTNVTAVLHATRAVIPGMTERGKGHIVNIGSTAGIHPLKVALYGATKAAIQMLSNNLRLELVGTGIRVTEICPGRVATEFYDVAVDDPDARAAAIDTGIDEIPAAVIADSILYALQTPPNVNVSRIELQPTEQTYGGTQFVPSAR